METPSTGSAPAAPVLAAPTSGGGGGGAGYPESVDSSPRSRAGEPWDEPLPASAPRLRLMCSYGGHIVPRPHDKSLCYLGGDTRIVVVDRHTTLADLSAKLSRSLLGGRPFTLKYQLPNEDLDSLISVTTDEDLDNMIEEYDRISSGSTHSGTGGAGGGKSSRLRLFLFPAKSESAPPSSMGSLVDDSKSETWFVDALNSAIGMGGMLPRGLSTDSAASSVNCLLGLEDDQNPSSNAAAAAAAAVATNAGPPVESGFVGEQANHYYPHLQLQQQFPPPPQQQQIPPQLPRPDSSGKLAAAGKQGQEISSVPDSPMLDKSSSFGSTSSAPSLANLPPIRVRPEDRGPDQRGSGLEDHFSQMNVAAAHKAEEAFREGAPGAFVTAHQVLPQAPFPAPPAPVAASASTPPVISPTGNPSTGNRAVFSDDEKPPDHGAPRKPPIPQSQSPIIQQQQQPQQQQQKTFDLPVSERPIYYPERASSGAPMSVLDAKPDGQSPVLDSNYRGHMQVPDPGYVVPIQHEQFQQQNQQQQQPQQQSQHQLQQYILPGSHLVQHHSSSTVVPVQSYYPVHPQMHPQQHLTQAAAHHYNSQLPMYFFPVQPNPAAYRMTMQPQQLQQQQQQQQQPNLIDPAAIPPAKSTVPLPNVATTGRAASAAPLRPELVAGANIYRGSTVATSMVAPPQPSPQLIHIANTDQSQPQYMSYRPIHHHVSQSVAPGYGYDFTNPVLSQTMFYAPATPGQLPSQYQAMSSAAATMLSDASPQLQLQQVDGKPGGSSP